MRRAVRALVVVAVVSGCVQARPGPDPLIEWRQATLTERTGFTCDVQELFGRLESCVSPDRLTTIEVRWDTAGQLREVRRTWVLPDTVAWRATFDSLANGFVAEYGYQARCADGIDHWSDEVRLWSRAGAATYLARSYPRHGIVANPRGAVTLAWLAADHSCAHWRGPGPPWADPGYLFRKPVPAWFELQRATKHQRPEVE